MPIIQSTKDNNYLSFDEEKHKYILNGARVPGATTFVHGGYVTSEALVSWMKGQTAAAAYQTGWDDGNIGFKPNATQMKEIIKAAKAADKKKSEEAAAIGTLTHDYAYEMEIKGGPSKELLEKIAQHKDKLIIEGCIEKFNEWRKTNADVIVSSEAIVASVIHQTGGKFDRLARRNGILVLSDFKTSTGIYVDQKIQLAAYRLMIREWLDLNVEAIEILRFGKEDGEFETDLVSDPKILDALEAQAIRCRDTYRFRLENETPYPKKAKKK